jgi:ABC-2 type transport system ATP-binding protein
LALDGISLAVKRGAVFGLLGPNGAGKSTLVKIMMTIVRATAASGTVLGRAVGDKGALARAGYLPEHHRFPKYLTGRQTLEFFGSLAGVDRETRRRRASELLEVVGMTEAGDRKMGTYSKGMMQRVGLAQALVNDPELVVLDEPTDGVDVQGRRDVRDVLLRLRSEGRTIFLNSHLLSELEQVCDRVAILVKGKVVKQGVIGELTLDRQRYEIEVGSEAEARAGVSVGKLDGVELSVSGGVIRAGTTDAGAIQPLIDRLRKGGCVVRRVQLVKPSLEDLFLEVVEGPAK